MSKALIEITGFEELQAKLKQLPDKTKRTELLKILGQVANPTLAAARGNAPVSGKNHNRYVGVTKGKRRKSDDIKPDDRIEIRSGNLRASIKKIIAKRSRVNPVLYVGAKASRDKDKRPDGYYAHMVVPKGFTGKKRKSGDINDFLRKSYNQTEGKVTNDALDKVSKYIQKQIDRLGNV